jgi:hypothetical protein
VWRGKRRHGRTRRFGDRRVVDALERRRIELDSGKRRGVRSRVVVVAGECGGVVADERGGVVANERGGVVVVEPRVVERPNRRGRGSE